MITSALLIIAIFFALYGIACAIECAVGINLLLNKKTSSRRFFTPSWELTNVFLVFGFTAFVVLFNGSLERLSHQLLSTLVIGLLALLVRSCIVLWLFYVSEETFPLWGRIVFAVSNFAIPLSFTAAGTYLLTGQAFWKTLAGWLVMLVTVLGLTAVGKLFLDGPSDARKLLSNELIFSAWLMVLGSFLPLALLRNGNHFQKWPIAALDLLSIFGLFAAYLVVTERVTFKLKYFAGLIGVVAPLLLALANRPYLINGNMKLSDAYGAANYASAFLIGSAVILPVVILGFWLFIKLVRQP